MRRVTWLCVFCCGIAAAARAEGPFFELDGTNGFWGSGGVPNDAFKLLQKVQGAGDAEIKCIAFTMDGDWVFLFGGNGYYTSKLDLPACKKLTELQKDNTDFRCVAFAPTGGWTILWGANGNWTEGEVPAAAFNTMQDVIKRGGEPRSIAFGPKGAWVLLFDTSGVRYGNVAPDLAKTLDNAVRRRLTVRCVAFTGSDWICLTNNGWWTSNLGLPSTRLIASNVAKGVAPKWIAVAPERGPHDFQKFAQILRDALAGKTAGGYAFEVLERGKVVAHGAEGWARAPWEKEQPSVKWTLDKPMGVASVSKTVTAVALLKLWEESQGTAHKFSLDDPFWPHIQRICPRAHEDVKHVTIRNLLMHRSGFKKTDDYLNPKDLEKLLTLPLAHRPGTVDDYQNNNFYTLRLVLEQIGRTDYTRYVKQQVLAPMGISHMETHPEAFAPTCGYEKVGTKRPGFPFDWQCASTAGAGGWFASVSDLGRFLEGIRTHKVLDAKTTQTMVTDSMGWDSNDPGCVKNGGWSCDEGPGGRGGSLCSAIGHFPDGVDAVLLVNCDAATDVEALLVRAWREGRAQ